MGNEMVKLGLVISQRISGGATTRGALERLSRATGLDTYFVVRVGDEVMYSERVEAPEAVHANTPLGVPRSLYATASGKLFLAFDEQLWEHNIQGKALKAFTERTLTNEIALRAELAGIRDQGYAMSRGESLAGIASLAAPLRSDGNNPIAALMVSGHESAIIPREHELARIVISVVKELEPHMASVYLASLKRVPS
jgi:DNA-binding IclR family transcriptional regulator